MTNWYPIYALAAGASTILLGLVAIAVTFLIRDYDKRSRWFLCGFFVLLITGAILSMATTVRAETDGSAAETARLEVAEYIVLLLLMPLLAAYILRDAGKPIVKNGLFAAECGAVGLSACVNLIGVIVYPVADPPLFSPLSILGTIFPVSVYVIMVVLLARCRKDLPKKRLVLCFALLFAPVFSQTFLFGLLIVFDQGDRYLKQKEENLRRQAEITVLQMRPHFIYNTMMSVYYLCEQDPKKAQAVTLDFSNYLRKNFSAVAKEGAIPFSEELEHAKAYLAVEKARFEDKLFVTFDTPATGFCLPVLTLQPLVENAVKHGVSPDLKPLTITVATKETDDGYELTVADDGPGFSMGDNGDPHIALENIRQRLSAIGASLSVSPCGRGGAVVRIFVPKKKAPLIRPRLEKTP